MAENVKMHGTALEVWHIIMTYNGRGDWTHEV